METSSSNRMTGAQRACGLRTMSCPPSNHNTHTHTHEHTPSKTQVLTHFCRGAHTFPFRMSGVGVGAVGAAEDASSEFVFLSGVGVAGGGGAV